MKQASIFLLLLGLSVWPLLAQNRPNSPKVSLEVGSISLWLGMSKVQAAKIAADAGYRAVDRDNNIVFLDQKGIVGTCSFVQDRLIFASRPWWRPNADSLTATLGALAALASYGSACELTHAPVNTPTMDVDRVFVTCGERSVLLVKGQASSPSDSEVIEVDERIGAMTSQ